MEVLNSDIAPLVIGLNRISHLVRGKIAVASGVLEDLLEPRTASSVEKIDLQHALNSLTDILDSFSSLKELSPVNCKSTTPGTLLSDSATAVIEKEKRAHETWDLSLRKNVTPLDATIVERILRISLSYIRSTLEKPDSPQNWTLKISKSHVEITVNSVSLLYSPSLGTERTATEVINQDHRVDTLKLYFVISALGQYGLSPSLVFKPTRTTLVLPLPLIEE